MPMSLEPSRTTPQPRHEWKDSSFQEAINQYIEGLSDKKLRQEEEDFLEKVQKEKNVIAPEDVEQHIHSQAKKKRSHNGDKEDTELSNAVRIAKKAVTVIRDYEGVIKSLVSVVPIKSNPVKIIWSAVTVVVNCADRIFKLFGMIEDQLESFHHLVGDISHFGHLYATWDEMQNLVRESYVSAFRFWSMVYRFLQRTKLKIFMDGLTSISLNKLATVAEDLNNLGERVRKTARMIEMTEHRCDKFREELNPKLADKYEENSGIYEKERPSSFFDDSNFSDWYNGDGRPILLLYAPPGYGKSILCSRIIDHIKKANPSVPVIHHFYPFNEERPLSTTLQHLAYQLFDRFCSDGKHKKLEQDLPYAWEERSSMAFQSIISMLVRSYDQVYFVVDGPDEECRTRTSDSKAKSVVDFLIDLNEQHPDIVRILCSSRDRQAIGERFRERFSNFTSVNVAQHLTEDMTSYLQYTIPGIINSVVGETSQQIVEKLCKRAPENFLLASFMIGELKKPCLSPLEVEDIIDGHSKDLKSTLDGYYKKAFERFKERQRRLTCEVFSLVAFAARPLTLNELSEAIGMLRSSSSGEHANSRDLDDREIPKLNSSDLQQMFHPLLVIEVGKSYEHHKIRHVCRLLHSTVRDFLEINPNVLHGEKDSRNPLASETSIKKSWIAEACMLYLGQDRFSDFLNKRGDDWIDRTEKPVVNHHFLTYSAKYWYKHLDYIQDAEREQWTARIIEFVESPNFKTCVQVQSLWVDAHFGNFRDSEGLSYLRRAFPKWFTESDAGKQIERSYNHFVYDWQHFLACRCNLSCLGELDRCWWTALDPYSFLAQDLARSRYISFRLQADRSDVVLGPRERFSGVAMSGTEIKVLQLKSHNLGRREFVCEHWDVSGETPVVRKQVICVRDAITNWLLYDEKLPDDSSMQPHSGAAHAAFSHDCRHLRIGSRMFSQNDQGDFVPMDGLNPESEQHPIYFEEFSSRGCYIVLANRREVPATIPPAAQRRIDVNNDTEPNPSSVEAPRNESGFFSFFALQVHDYILQCKSFLSVLIIALLERLLSPLATSDSRYRNEFQTDIGTSLTPVQLRDTDGDSEPTESSSTNSDEEANETWSECTSDHSEDIASEEEESDSVDATDSSSSLASRLSSRMRFMNHSRRRKVSRETDSEDEDSELGASRQSTTDDGSDSEVEDLNSCVSTDSMREDESDSDTALPSDSSDESIFEEAKLPDRRRGVAPRREKRPAQLASIVVFDISGGRPKRLFCHKQKISRPLLDSPPAIHPSVPLAIWPIGNGDILFADFQANTYFTRHLRPSTYNARHVSVKCHFSDCGRFLHTASFEVPSSPIHASDPRSHVRRALLVSSFRLCARQATKCSPTLIHRARINLTEVTASTDEHPLYTLTWRPRELYLTCSSAVLSVYRINLFRPKPTESGHDSAVLTPQRQILLPGSAQSRAVYYFPPTSAHKTSRILIDCEKMVRGALRAHNQKELSPPVGCLLDEEAHLGGWKKEDRVLAVVEHGRSGALDRRMEMFNPEDDCDDLTEFYL